MIAQVKEKPGLLSNPAGTEIYAPNEFNSGNGTKQDAMIHAIRRMKAIVSPVEISRCNLFFITKVFKFFN